MPKIITHESVELYFKSEGYQLLSQYKGYCEELNVVCPNSHKTKTTLSRFKRGNRCNYCRVDKTRNSQDLIEAAFKSKGCKLLSKYNNSSQKLDYICRNGHRHSISWSHFKNGRNCRYCSKAELHPDDVREMFEQEGYTLTSEYKDSRTNIEYVCANGHSHSVCWSEFRRGTRCPYCTGKRTDIDAGIKFIESLGFKLLEAFKADRDGIKLLCPEGHKFTSRLSYLRKGNRCPHCSGRIVDRELISNTFNLAGYRLLSEYERCDIKMKCQCPEGHLTAISWSNFSRGQRCSKCAKCGYNPSKHSYLYYVRFDFPDLPILYKIGITNRTVESRIGGQDMRFCTIISSKLYENGFDAQQQEAFIKQKFKDFQYKGSPVLKKGGNTELFVCDILMLDKEASKVYN